MDFLHHRCDVGEIFRIRLDGVELASDDPVYNEKKLSIKYYLKASELAFKPNLNAFFDLHMQQGYRSIYIREFDKTFQVRFSEVTGYQQKRGFSLSGDKWAYIDIDYVMDNPLQFLDPGIINPVGPAGNDTRVSVNGTDLSAYGIIVQDVYSTALKYGVKEGLVYRSSYGSGLVSDTGISPKKQKQAVTIECRMSAGSRADFITNYTALFNNIKAGVITINLTAAGKELKCCYLSMSGFAKRPWTGKASASFRLEFISNVYTI
jgi:hypothetical protein